MLFRSRADDIEKRGAVLFSASLAALVSAAVVPGSFREMLVIGAGCLAALFLAPAIETALEMVVPRHIDLSERYARKQVTAAGSF